ncbi:MAG: hypothetical protein WC832_01510 [Anaerolineales bacterium]
MTKLKEILKIDSGYASYVNLQTEYFDEGKRRDRMERYRPITSHRLAFEKVANSINPQDRRFYFLSGSYGTGKSHLCLMLASYFAHQSDLPEMRTFFKNYKNAQDNVKVKPGETLRDVTQEQYLSSNLQSRRSVGRYFLAICDFNRNLEFEGTILAAIDEGLKIEDKDIKLNSYYLQAIDKLNLITGTPIGKLFLDALDNDYSDWTYEKLINGLKGYEELALLVFKNCFKTVTTVDFTPDKANLNKIIEAITKSPEFIAKYKGIVIIYDEFGYALDSKKVDLDRLHGFAEFCANSGMSSQLPVIFIGTGHKTFPNHGEVGDSIYYSTLQARVNEIALQTQGMEDIIAAIVHPLKESDIWTTEVERNSQIFSQFTVECQRLNLFTWLPAPVLKQNIIENIFPMHPLATYSLLELAKEVGSDNRSVFKFFSPEFVTGEEIFEIAEEFSFPWYVGRTDILDGNKLNLYTADLLIDYFIRQGSSGIESKKLTNKSRSAIANYDNTRRELLRYQQKDSNDKLFDEADETMHRILKVMLIFEIISNDEIQILSKHENVCFALNAYFDAEKDAIKSRLDILAGAGIIYRNQNQYYEFRRTDAADIRRLLEEYKSDPLNQPKDILDVFRDQFWSRYQQDFIEAKDYNLTFSEDKRLRVSTLTLSEIQGHKISQDKQMEIFTYLEKERKQIPFGKDFYEGTAIYVLCENAEQIDRARSLVKSNKQERVFIGLPKSPLNIKENIWNFLFIKGLKESKEYSSFTTFDLAEISKLETSTLLALKNLGEKYFSADNIIWYNKEGESIATNKNKNHDIANVAISLLYKTTRNNVAHNDFNKSHLTIAGGAIQKIVSEACNLLADNSKPITIDNTWADNRGGKKYIKNLFVDRWVLEQTGIEGDIRFYQISTDTEKFKNVFPGFIWLLNRLKLLKEEKLESFFEIVRPLYEIYGLGDIAVALFVMVARRHLRDSLTFKKEENAISDIDFSNSSDIIDLVNRQYPKAIVVSHSVSLEDKQYFQDLYSVFSNTKEAGKEYGINDAFAAIKEWWSSQSILVKTSENHLEKEKPFVKLFNKIDTLGVYGFIKADLPALFELDKDEKLTDKKRAALIAGVKEFKETCQDLLSRRQKRILIKLREVFGAMGDTDEHIKDAIEKWYNLLDPKQKDSYSSFHSSESKGLMKVGTSLSNITAFIFEVLPENYGFGKLKDWNDDHEYSYIERIISSKKLIEINKIRVESPKYSFTNGTVDQRTKKVEYSENLHFEIEPPTGAKFVFITDNGSDPTSEKSDRKKISTKESIKLMGNKKIMIVAEDSEGNYGEVIKWDIYDSTQKVKINGQPDVLGDIVINFIFPKDKVELKASLVSFIALAQKQKIADKLEIKKILEELL